MSPCCCLFMCINVTTKQNLLTKGIYDILLACDVWRHRQSGIQRTKQNKLWRQGKVMRITGNEKIENRQKAKNVMTYRHEHRSASVFCTRVRVLKITHHRAKMNIYLSSSFIRSSYFTKIRRFHCVFFSFIYIFQVYFRAIYKWPATSGCV